MKLVDILALELKVFPESYRYILFDGANGCYADLGPTTKPLTIDCSECTDELAFPVYRNQWQAAVDALKAGVHPTESMALHHQEVGRIARQWNGEGLPPVGTVCSAEISEGVWAESEVIYRHPYQSWRAAIAYGSGPDILGWATKFRQIRTPEQIAAHERMNSAKLFHSLVCPEGKWHKLDDVARESWATIYDAGFRKFEIVDN